MTLDRSLTYKKHIESLQCKVNATNGLLRCLAGSSWGAYTSTLRTGALMRRRSGRKCIEMAKWFESARGGTESAREGTESAREGTESAREGTESAREGIESAREGTESAREGTESARLSTESALVSLR